ncbi:MAG: class I SAM-dependent methyltransferase [Lactobacillales bacterium]|jgi:SAM-dependent methyltransferase|nr:class I SAM-dependent methyltransferase [Lactobacillales bacterium]
MKKSGNINEYDLLYFNRRIFRTEIFWNRLGEKPDLTDKVILDVGCGHGALCFSMALGGAKKVVGVDIDANRIAFAKEYLRLHYPQFSKIVEFHRIDLKDYSKEAQFDYMVSEDTFEHIIDLPEMIKEMRLRLKPGGLIYTGFGPLYNDFYGDHKRTKCIVPWGHVVCADEKIIKRLNKKRETPIQSIYDLGLNKLSLADYRKIFQDSGLKIVSFKVNVSRNLILRLFSLISFILPFLKEYFAHNIYAILKK